ncbi:MAG TPA: GspH/FimT family pseudopilin [Rhizomicrobium sp.]|jgi:general secretion pathway protein H
MRQAGYTLLELLVVLAIVGLISGAVLPMFAASRPGLQARAAARAIAQDFRTARQAAISSGAKTRVVMNRAANRYAILPDGPARVLPKGIAFSVQTAGSGDEIDFFPDGSSSGGAVIVQSGGANHRIVAHWPSGRISLDE